MKEYEEIATAAKNHLEKYRGSICEIRVGKNELEPCKKVVESICGSELMKRILFLPKREDSLTC